MSDENVKLESRSQNESADELRKIVQDAIDHVIARPDGRRGPYVIRTDELQNTKLARAS